MDELSAVIEEVKPFAGESGTCSRDVAVDFINKARRLLWNKVDYEHTQEYFCIKCVEQCFYLPSRYKQIRLAWIGNNPVSLGDEWYQSLPQIGMLDPRNSCHKKIVQVGSSFVIFQNYDDEAYRLGVMCENSRDEDKEITVVGKDRNGVIRKETIAPEQKRKGNLSATYWRSIIQVTKPKTKGRIRLYGVDEKEELYLLMAVYEPQDINPEFRKFKVAGVGDNYCAVTLLAKLKYFDLEDDNDLVEFPTEAIKFAISALVAQSSRDNAKYMENLSMAVSEVLREIADNEIPTASPLRFFHTDNVENLIH